MKYSLETCSGAKQGGNPETTLLGFGETAVKESGLPDDKIWEVYCEGFVVLDGEDEDVIYPVEEGPVVMWSVVFDGNAGNGGVECTHDCGQER